MSGEIEKKCPRCGGSGEQEDGYCGRCGGYGTIVDVEAQLRAEVASLTATIAERDGEVARLEGREREAAQLFYRLLAGEFMESSARVWLAGSHHVL